MLGSSVEVSYERLNHQEIDGLGKRPSQGSMGLAVLLATWISWGLRHCGRTTAAIPATQRPKTVGSPLALHDSSCVRCQLLLGFRGVSTFRRWYHRTRHSSRCTPCRRVGIWHHLKPRGRPCPNSCTTGTDREFSASFDHQASATNSFLFLGLSPPKANKTVSFFVSFHRGATQSGILFLVSIARATARRIYHCRPWLSDVSHAWGCSVSVPCAARL